MVFYKLIHPLRFKALPRLTTLLYSTRCQFAGNPLKFSKCILGQFSTALKQVECIQIRKYSSNAQFSNCNTPTQLRSHINRYLYKQPQPMSSYIVSALQSCSAMAANAKEMPPKKKDEIDIFLASEKSITEQTFGLASELFERVKDTPALDLAVYNAYLEVCANTWQVDEMFKVYKDMRQKRYVPDITTFKLMILCAVKAREIPRALEAVELGTQDISHSIYTQRRMKVGMRVGTGALCGGWLTITLGMLLPNVPQIGGMGVALTVFFCLRSGATGLFSAMPVMHERQVPFDIRHKYKINIQSSLMDDVYKFFYQYLLLHLPTHGDKSDLELTINHMRSKGLVVDENSLTKLKNTLTVKSNHLPTKNTL